MQVNYKVCKNQNAVFTSYPDTIADAQEPAPDESGASTSTTAPSILSPPSRINENQAISPANVGASHAEIWIYVIPVRLLFQSMATSILILFG